MTRIISRTKGNEMSSPNLARFPEKMTVTITRASSRMLTFPLRRMGT